MKIYVAEMHFCSTEPWDSFTAGVYSSLEEGISALKKWVAPEEGIIIEKERVTEKDIAHFKIHFSDDGSDDIYCSIEPWEVDADFPETF